MNFRDFIALSLLFHILLFLGIYFLKRNESEVPQRVTVRPISDEELRAIKNQISGQLVQTAKTKKSETEVDSKYLSEQNQKVDQETLARKNDVFQDGARKSKSGKKKPTLADLTGIRFKNVNADQGEESSNSHNNSMQDPASMDYLPNVKPGDRTALNTKEFVFYSYYNRIHQKIEMIWPGILREKIYASIAKGEKKFQNVYQMVDVLVMMNKAGDVAQVKVLQGSSILDLDNSAIEAFNRAGPFPHPPPGIADPDGFIRMRWGFSLQTGSLDQAQ